MVFAVRDDLKQEGVTDENIHTEGFTGLEIEQVLTGSDYNALVESLNQASLVSMTDDKGHIIYANPKFVEVSKYPLHELLGQNHRILKSHHQPDQLFDEMWATISSGKIWRGEIKNKAKDGSYYWVDTSITPVLGASGHPERYISVRFLITDRKERELLLQKTKAINEAVLSSITDGLIAADRNGRIILLNPTGERILGWNADEILGKPIEDALLIKDTHGHDMPTHDIPFHKALQAKKTSTIPPSYSLIGKNSKRFHATLSVAPIMLENKVIGAVGVFNEVGNDNT